MFLSFILFECFLLIGFAIASWSDLKTEVPDITKDTVQVRVIGKQFKWYFHYPGADGKFGKTSFDKIDSSDNPVGIDPDSPYGADDKWSDDLTIGHHSSGGIMNLIADNEYRTNNQSQKIYTQDSDTFINPYK